MREEDGGDRRASCVNVPTTKADTLPDANQLSAEPNAHRSEEIRASLVGEPAFQAA